MQAIETPLSSNPHWADITPIPQDDGENPVVPIDYSAKFSEAMGYFRAVVAKQEKSERALYLTAMVITLNASNYTVWHYRRLVMEALKFELKEELDYIDYIVEDNPKNYQLWYHRRWVAGKIGASGAKRELNFTADQLDSDSKNYHAWSHRQWVLRELGGWEEELKYCSQLLEDDVRNNSAWNQRYMVIKESPLLGGVEALRDDEIEYCIKAIKKAPSNESGWRYLRGLFKADPSKLALFLSIRELCDEVLAHDPECVHALSLLLDLEFATSSSPEAAQSVCTKLMDADPIRRRYWQFRRGLLAAA